MCHPNTNFEFYVTTSSYGSTTSWYEIVANSGGAYSGKFVSGHPHYKIVLADEFDPGIASFNAVQLKFNFENGHANMKPVVDIDVFGVNDNNIHTATIQTSTSYAVGTSFEVSTFFLIPASTPQASYIHINTNGSKFGLISVELIGM
ncbi:hypothetical protein [Bradymonas sediminis]|uniref:hypothetical protein n=1 Tax=Bradymonas sediminis TaxID=1548548 RepID=UPI00105E4B2B|nr:hypothetical protein [Bradymonas sediminis]